MSYYSHLRIESRRLSNQAQRTVQLGHLWAVIRDYGNSDLGIMRKNDQGRGLL